MVFEDTSVNEVIDEIAKVKAGAAVVLTSDDRLGGIFTQGDFLRAFRAKGDGIGEESVRSLMTSDPLTINKEFVLIDIWS